MNYEQKLAELRKIYKERPELRKVVLLQVRALKKAEQISKLKKDPYAAEVVKALF